MAGAAYVTGWTISTDFPTENPYQTYQGIVDGFVTKLSSAGNSLIYSTYLGGSDIDQGVRITTDAFGVAYVTGGTVSTDFPTLNPFQTDQGDNEYDVFVTKLSAAGNSLIYSTYLGGSGEDVGYGIAVDAGGAAYVTGQTNSADFPTLNPFQTYQGDRDVFVFKLSTSGSSLVYGTYLGGSDYDLGQDIGLDAAGAAYVTGLTYSTNFPTLNPLQTYQGGASYSDVFVTKLSSGGGSLVYSTYLGGSSYDAGYGIAVNAAGAAYVTGPTYSTNFPTLNPYQTDQDTTDVFVTKLSSSGRSLIYSTYLGGSYSDGGGGVAVDNSGSAYITGSTSSPDFPTVNPYQTHQGAGDVFVSKLEATHLWTILVYLNGDNNLEQYAIADINEMEMVGSTAEVNVVVQVDRIPGFDSSNGDWNDTRRYYIDKDSNTSVISSTRLDTLPELGEQNMGAESTLVNFVEWGITNYPATHYAVVVWNHGDGWYKKLFDSGFDDILFKGVSFDSTSINDGLGVSNGEWKRAISRITETLGRKIDLVGFDACLMQMWEVMDITDAYADYVVASEDTEGSNGWGYAEFLSALAVKPTMSVDSLGKEIVDAAVDGDAMATQSGVGLARVSGLTSAVNDLACELLKATEDTAIVDSIRLQLHVMGHEFYFKSHIDLYEFASLVNSDPSLPDSLRAAAGGVMAAVDSAVIHNRYQPSYSWVRGIAVYYPDSRFTPSSDNRYEQLPVASATCWDEFIKGDVYIPCNVDGEGGINIADLTHLVDYLFRSGSTPCPKEAGDCNCNGGVNIADITYLVDYLFRNGPPPPPCP